MAWYYVRTHADGTGTAGGSDAGRYATQQTGDWDTTLGGVANYYPSIVAAMGASTTPGLGDFIICSDIHAFSQGSSITYTGDAVVISVDDTAIDQYLAGATETTTGGSADFIFATSAQKLTFIGVTFSCADNFQMNGSNASVILWDSEVILTGSGDRFAVTGDGAWLSMKNSTVTLSAGTSNGVFDVSGGSRIQCFGTNFVTTSGTTQDVFYEGAINGGMSAIFEGCDMSTFAGYIVGAVGGTEGSDDRIHIEMYDCEIGSLTGWVEEGFTNLSHKLIAQGCSIVNADSEWQFYQETWNGTVTAVDSSDIVRVDSTVTFDGGETISFRIDATSDCSPWMPVEFDLPNKFLALSAVSTDHIRMYFVVDTMTLTDTEFWAEVIHRDGTDLKTPVFRANRDADVIAAGTTHTDDSGSSDWEDNSVNLTGYNEYRMQVDTTPGNGSSDCVPVIRINCGVDTDTGSDPIYVSINITAEAA